MRAIKWLVGLTVVAVATSAIAAPTVTYNVGAFDGGASVLPNTGTAPVQAKWAVDVVVSTTGVAGDNMGLASFGFSLGVYPKGQERVPGQEVAKVGFLGAEQDLPVITTNTVTGRQWTRNVYKSEQAGSVASKSRIVDDATNGGPGLDVFAKSGYPVAGVAYLDQVAGAYLNSEEEIYWDSVGIFTGKTKAGVGLESKKADLLRLGSAGKYYILNGVFDVRTWDPGTYVLCALNPPGASLSTAVISAGSDLNYDPDNPPADPVPMPKTDITNISGALEFGQWEFVVTPEPATLLLMAGAGLLIRRRMA